MGFLNIDPSTIDPNVVYVVLVLGLWVGVTAVKVPGTGILELFSGADLVAAVILMTLLPTNWWAALLLVIGLLTFIVIPFLQLQSHSTTLALGGLALQVIGSMLLFNGKTVSWVLVITMIVIQLGYFRYLLLPLLERALKQETVDRDSQLIGARGRVIKALDPVGTVNVDAELWTATSDRPLQSGEEVIVVERDGLQLYVEGVKHKNTPKDDAEEVSSL